MKASIIYDSVYRNTKITAEAIEKSVSKEYEIRIAKADKASATNTEEVDLLNN